MDLKPATIEQRCNLDLALDFLKQARHMLAVADCPATLDKVRSAIKSAEGAQRHMNRRLDK